MAALSAPRPGPRSPAPRDAFVRRQTRAACSSTSGRIASPVASRRIDGAGDGRAPRRIPGAAAVGPAEKIARSRRPPAPPRRRRRTRSTSREAEIHQRRRDASQPTDRPACSRRAPRQTAASSTISHRASCAAGVRRRTAKSRTSGPSVERVEERVAAEVQRAHPRQVAEERVEVVAEQMRCERFPERQRMQRPEIRRRTAARCARTLGDDGRHELRRREQRAERRAHGARDAHSA